ncbi:MAG TPA: precorrin-8X methylmutase [Azospirillaceae bacterium]|nr:precorrin-8X methylmutase [Azospirillaceae bacterium]
MAEYLRDPAEIYRQSFAAIAAETDFRAVPESLRGLATRLIHAVGMVDLVGDLAWGGDAVTAGRAALAAGKPVYADCHMVASAIMASRLPAENRILCTLGEPAVDEVARMFGTTRSAAAVELWRDALEGAVVAIGNAPTALFHLLDMIENGGPRPAVIFGFPVGFVGAAESKEELIRRAGDIPFVTVRGRRGGSPLASAAVNALMVGP